MLNKQFAAFLQVKGFQPFKPNQELVWIKRLHDIKEDLVLTLRRSYSYNGIRNPQAEWFPSKINFAVSGSPNRASINLRGKNKSIALFTTAENAARALYKIYKQPDRTFKELAGLVLDNPARPPEQL